MLALDAHMPSHDGYGPGPKAQVAAQGAACPTGQGQLIEQLLGPWAGARAHIHDA